MKKIVILLLGCTFATGLLAAVQDRETHQPAWIGPAPTLSNS